MREPQQPRIIVGQVNSDGTIARGYEGFRVKKNGTGRYLINFEPGFKLTVCVGNVMDATSNNVTYFANNSESQTECWITGSPSGQADKAFYFIAVGQAV